MEEKWLLLDDSGKYIVMSPRTHAELRTYLDSVSSVASQDKWVTLTYLLSFIPNGLMV
jgi:hypothetical protein